MNIVSELRTRVTTEHLELEEEALYRIATKAAVLPPSLLETARPHLIGGLVGNRNMDTQSPSYPLYAWTSRLENLSVAAQYRVSDFRFAETGCPLSHDYNYEKELLWVRAVSKYLLPIQLVSYSINVDSSRLEHGTWTTTIGHIPIPNELLRTTAGSAALGGAEPYQLGHLVYRYLYNCTAARTGKSFASSTLGALLDIGELGAPYSLFTDSMGSSSACGYILRFYPVVEAGSTDSSLSALFNRSMGENCIYAV